MKLSLNKFAYSISALCLILTGVWWFWDEYAASETAFFQQTPGWQSWKEKFPANADSQHLESNDPEIPEETKPSVLIRSDSAKKALLLKHNYANDVFIYDSITKMTRPASEDEWTKADGEITRCRAQIGAWFGTDIEINSYPSYRISRNGNKVETYGKYALYASKSPSQENLAVLSAYGPVKSAGRGLIGLGGSEPDVYGQMYVEIKRLDGEMDWRAPVRLGRHEEKESYRLCWSAEEKFVVIYRSYLKFAVIETGVQR